MRYVQKKMRKEGREGRREGGRKRKEGTNISKANLEIVQ